MTGSDTVPPSLIPYLCGLPEYSLLLLTYVLGASSNWLLLRLLHATFQPPSTGNQGQHVNDRPTGVIFISFLRDYSFWRDGARKLGLDLARLAAQNRFIFIDGMSELFSTSSSTTITSQTLKPVVKGDHVVLRDARLKSIEAALLDLVKRMNASTETGPVVLLVDGLDFVMAAGEESAEMIGDMIMGWREIKHVHSLAITASADSPLIHGAMTPLETNHLAHVVGMGYQANVIMGLRLLDSGTAKDVSGVLKISRGAQTTEDVDENEFLYFVGGDGGVKVFERGAQR